jgi:hypothetical protein
VTEPTRSGQLNHFQIDVSRDRIVVYGTDAGTSRPLVHLVTIRNAALGFTRGYIWLEDVHYNANKDINGDTPLEAMHTFTWDNVGFDGPILPRDLGFDAPDNLKRLPNYPRLQNLGWYATASAPARITIPRVSGIKRANGGLLMFDFIDPDTAPINLKYSLNRHRTHVAEWPYPGKVTGSPRAIAVPISLSEVVSGTNHLKIWSGQDGLIISNVDLIMKGAGWIVPPTTAHR